MSIRSTFTTASRHTCSRTCPHVPCLRLQIIYIQCSEDPYYLTPFPILDLHLPLLCSRLISKSLLSRPLPLMLTLVLDLPLPLSLLAINRWSTRPTPRTISHHLINLCIRKAGVAVCVGGIGSCVSLGGSAGDRGREILLASFSEECFDPGCQFSRGRKGEGGTHK
jgi:hypothetical protein